MKVTSLHLINRKVSLLFIIISSSLSGIKWIHILVIVYIYFVMCCSTFNTLLSAATDHLILYIERSDKQVVGTTYEDLHKLSDLLTSSGLLDGGSVHGTAITSTQSTVETGEESVGEPKAEETPERELTEEGQYQQFYGHYKYSGIRLVPLEHETSFGVTFA